METMPALHQVCPLGLSVELNTIGTKKLDNLVIFPGDTLCLYGMS